MESLTFRQRQVLVFLQEKIQESGIPPSIREIGHALRISSLRGVTCHLEALEKKGYIRRLPHARGICLLKTERENSEAQSPRLALDASGRSEMPLPLVGQVAAGKPILAQENLTGSILVDPLFAHGDNCFVLRVRGDSMIEAGIFDGDYIVIRQQQTAENGDIVVVMVEEEATVKRFYREGQQIRLQPENSAMEPVIISPQQASLLLLGKVISLLRKIR
jgi:repressor LexA|tara:strand:- start:126 stop:782 length:657 start_codon:yes stop_codon:yes gene_type:complete